MTSRDRSLDILVRTLRKGKRESNPQEGKGKHGSKQAKRYKTSRLLEIYGGKSPLRITSIGIDEGKRREKLVTPNIDEPAANIQGVGKGRKADGKRWTFCQGPCRHEPCHSEDVDSGFVRDRRKKKEATVQEIKEEKGGAAGGKETERVPPLLLQSPHMVNEV